LNYSKTVDQTEWKCSSK